MSAPVKPKRAKYEEYVCTLSTELRIMAKEELREDDNIRAQSLLAFRNWIMQQPYLEDCRLDANFLLRFLRVKKFSLPMAQEMLCNYLATRNSFPEIFGRLDCEDETVSDLITKGLIFPLRERDINGRRVLYSNINSIDTHVHSSSDVVRTFLVGLETLLEDEENQIRGFTYILNYKDVGLASISIWTPTVLSRSIAGIRRGVPLRHKEINIMNLHSMLGNFFELAKSFCSDKVQKRITIHRTIEELQRIVPPSIFPQEHGGKIPMKDMIDSWKKELLKSRDRLVAMDEMKVDEDWKAKNVQDLYSVMGCEGSFKKLNLD